MKLIVRYSWQFLASFFSPISRCLSRPSFLEGKWLVGLIVIVFLSDRFLCVLCVNSLYKISWKLLLQSVRGMTVAKHKICYCFFLNIYIRVLQCQGFITTINRQHKDKKNVHLLLLNGSVHILSPPSTKICYLVKLNFCYVKHWNLFHREK